LLLCTIIVFSYWAQGRGISALMSAGVFSLGVLLAQHRSVWVAALGVLCILMLTSSSKARLQFIAAGVLTATAMSLILASGAGTNLFTQLITAAENIGTYSARQTSWEALVNQLMNSGDLVSILFGAPM